MGVFSKFKSAKASGGARNYLAAGEHDIRIGSVKFDKTRNNIELFAIQGVVESTTSTEEAMQPPNTIDWMTMANKDAYAGNVKQFFCAAFDLTEQQVEEMSEADFEEAMKELTGPEQRAAGRLIHAICREAVSKEQKTYVAVQWVAIPEERQSSGYASHEQQEVLEVEQEEGVEAE